MKISGKLLCFLSALIFILVATYAATRLLTIKNEGMMVCSTKGIMRFENMEDENVNGNIHFSFGANGKGSIVVEGYTTSKAGWLYLQRYVKFDYTTKRVSPPSVTILSVNGSLVPPQLMSLPMLFLIILCVKCQIVMMDYLLMHKS